MRADPTRIHALYERSTHGVTWVLISPFEPRFVKYPHALVGVLCFSLGSRLRGKDGDYSRHLGSCRW